METGKVEYAPDYRSERRAMKVQASDSGRRFVDAKELIEGELTRVQHEDAEHAAWAEHTRLEREVIEAAKADYLRAKQGSGSNADIDAIIQSRNRLNAATSALLKFESCQRAKK